jgi:hypothetical protein
MRGAVCGYYTFLALALNVARTAVSKDAAPLEPLVCAG